MKAPDLPTLLIAGGAFLAGAIAERALLGRWREGRRRREDTKAQLAALERMAELLDDEFGDTLSFTGQASDDAMCAKSGETRKSDSGPRYCGPR